MGRPPGGGAPAFRFTHAEVTEMESQLQAADNALPPRSVIHFLADKFSNSLERAGKSPVLPKQVWNWFQNRRYAHNRTRSATKVATPKLVVSPAINKDDSPAFTIASPAVPGKSPLDSCQIEFEAKSARDGAWYDVAAFLAHRFFETSEPEVRVRFAGFGAEEDEWINVNKCVRQRSLPCEAAECASVTPDDLILCFQEGKEQALYFDAHVLDAQRRRHDARGCRCRFLVRYDHDLSEEIVPLRKVCRRPETDYRLSLLQASRATASIELHSTGKPATAPAQLAQRSRRQRRKMIDVNTDEVMLVAPAPASQEELVEANVTAASHTMQTDSSGATTADMSMDDAAVDAVMNEESVDKAVAQEENTMN